VALCLCGVLLVGQGDRLSEKASGGDSEELYGDACALLGAVCYGLYTTLIAIKMPDSGEHGVSTSLLFGHMGALSMLLGAPVVVWMAATGSGGVDKLTSSTLGFIITEELLDSVLANYLYARATILAAPSVAAVGESLTIPLSIVAEAALAAAGSPLVAGADNNVSSWDVSGGVLVTLGFLLLALAP